MPYKSDAQRRWAHTEKGEEALGGPKNVHEWDEASKGKDLPEHVKKMDKGGIVAPVSLAQDKDAFKPGGFPPDPKSVQHMADGGEVSDLENLLKSPNTEGQVTVDIHNVPETESDNFIPQVGEGMSQGINHDLDAVKEFLMKLYNSPTIQHGNPELGSTLGSDTSGFQGMANKASEGTLPPAANEVTTQDMRYSGGGAVTMPHREKSGPGINTTPHEKYAYGGPVQVSHGYAEGGAVDTDFMNQMRAGTVPGLENPPPPTFNPNEGLPPVLPAIQVPSAISQYVGAQKNQIDKFGPEQQMAVTNQLIQQRQGLGSKIPVALGGLADSIMQGVARAGNPGFANQIQGQQNKLAEEKEGTMEKAGQQNLQQTEAKMKLDALNPDSALSASKREQNEPLLVAMGFNPKTVGLMSAAEMDQAINTLKDVGLKDREIMVKRMEMEIKLKEQYETARHNRAEEGVKGQEIQSGELEKSATEPFMSRVAQFFGANPSGQALQNQALAGTGVKPTPQVAVTGPYGQTVQRDGKTYVWSPISQKYHPE